MSHFYFIYIHNMYTCVVRTIHSIHHVPLNTHLLTWWHLPTSISTIIHFTWQTPLSATAPSLCTNKAGQTVCITVAPFLEYAVNQSLFISCPPRAHTWTMGVSCRVISQLVSTSRCIYGRVDFGVIRKAVSLLTTSLCTNCSKICEHRILYESLVHKLTVG